MKNILYIIVLSFGLSMFSCSQPQAKNITVKVKSDYNPEAKLDSMGIVLPKTSTPVANFVNTIQVGNLLFLSGNGPLKPDGKFITGKVGQDLSIEEGYGAARLTAINQIAILKDALGDLSRVKRIFNCNHILSS